MRESGHSSTVRRVGRGILWVTVAQVAMIVGQFGLGAVTARVFAPEVFGWYAAALSLQAIFVMATTTGVPSYVLMRPHLSHGDVARMRAWTAIAALVTAGAFWVVLPWWLELLRAPGGVVFAPVLAVAQCLTPPAALELALVRRQRKSGADAAIYGGAGLAGLIVAAVATIQTQAPQSLAAAPLIAAFLTLPLALLAQGRGRRGDAVGPALEPARKTVRYLAGVSGVNAVHFTITQIPTWVLSTTFGPRILGFYSRATSLTSTAASGVSTSLMRVVQPYWRDREPGPSLERALSDALRVSSGIAISLFSVVAVLAPDFVAVWLGEGWEIAGRFAIPLALGAAAQVPFAVLTGAYEMKARLRAVRNAQVAMLALGGLGAAGAAAGLDSLAVVSIFAAMPWAGLLWLIARSGHTRGARLHIADLGPSLWWAAILAAASFAGSYAAHHFEVSVLGSTHLASLLAGGILAVAAAALTIKRHPLASVLRERRDSMTTSLD